MHIDKALSQISEIHAQVLKTEVFRGYRAVTMLLTATVAIAAALIQSTLLPASTANEYIMFWLVVALVCATLCAVDLFRRSLRVGGAGHRWRVLLVVFQSVPALGVGAVISAVFLQRGDGVHLLPGLWAMLFALGIWSSRPYLPKAVGVVALLYALAGTLLLIESDALVPSPWSMGLTFGIGQTALAGVLYLDLERSLGLPRSLGTTGSTGTREGRDHD